MQNIEKSYFPALTGVRALAAYMVFIHHFIPFQWESRDFNLGYFFGEFHVGVTFFFVLSGFLIHNRYSDYRELNFSTYGKYFISRVSRIMPIFCILSTICFIYNFYFHRQDAGLFLKNFGLWILNISLLKGFFSGLHFSGIPQSWSLTVEFCFYGIAPFLFTKVKNVLLYPRVSAILLFFGFILVFIFSKLPLHGFLGDNRFMLSYSFFGRSFEFFMGCYLSFQFKKWSVEKEKNGIYTFLSLFVILFLIYILSIFRRGDIYGVHTFPGLIVNNFFLPIAIIIFFRGLIFENTFISRAFSSSLGQLLGKSSYAFYLIHVGFIEVGLHKFVSSNAAILFLLINIISIGIYLYIEEPLNDIVKKKLLRILNKP
jgi:peptidoglycan/LPS O-acetylase OafA/YrhL